MVVCKADICIFETTWPKAFNTSTFVVSLIFSKLRVTLSFVGLGNNLISLLKSLPMIPTVPEVYSPVIITLSTNQVSVEELDLQVILI